LLLLIITLRRFTYMKTPILVADEHEIMRSGIVSALSSYKDFDIVAETDNGSDVLFLYREHRPSLVTLDISLPGMNGLEVARELRREDPDVKIMFLTMQLNENLLVQALRAGAKGYIIKNAERNILVEGAKAVSRGRTYFNEPVLRIMADFYVTQHVPDDLNTKSAHDFGLTGREMEILNMIVESMTSQDIADKLYISLRTVETHRSNIMQKLGLKNSAALVRFAIENGICVPPRQVV